MRCSNSFLGGGTAQPVAVKALAEAVREGSGATQSVAVKATAAVATGRDGTVQPAAVKAVAEAVREGSGATQSAAKLAAAVVATGEPATVAAAVTASQLNSRYTLDPKSEPDEPDEPQQQQSQSAEQKASRSGACSKWHTSRSLRGLTNIKGVTDDMLQEGRWWSVASPLLQVWQAMEVDQQVTQLSKLAKLRKPSTAAKRPEARTPEHSWQLLAGRAGILIEEAATGSAGHVANVKKRWKAKVITFIRSRGSFPPA